MFNEVYDEVINDEPFSIYSVITYVKENIIGLLLLLFSILIVIFVDYISRINNIIFSTTNILHNVPISGIPQIQIPKHYKTRKFRKR